MIISFKRKFLAAAVFVGGAVVVGSATLPAPSMASPVPPGSQQAERVANQQGNTPPPFDLSDPEDEDELPPANSGLLPAPVFTVEADQAAGSGGRAGYVRLTFGSPAMVPDFNDLVITMGRTECEISGLLVNGPVVRIDFEVPGGFSNGAACFAATVGNCRFSFSIGTQPA